MQLWCGGSSMKTIEKNLRDKVFAYVKKKYGTTPEYLWTKFPNYAILRHDDNNKWYALIMNISYDKIDLEKSGNIDVLNIKLNDILLRDLLIQREGYYIGYHISRGNWISIVLNGIVDFNAITHLIDISFQTTASRLKKQQNRPPKEWLIPANPKYYDIEHAFDDTNIIDWKQGVGVKKGDTVFLYIGAPVSAILYKCKIVETDIPYECHNEKLNITKLMKIKLQKRYKADKFTFERLKNEYGIFAVRGARGIPNNLSYALKGK